MEHNDNHNALDEIKSGKTADQQIPDGARQFPCHSCGGALLFMPGSSHLQCPYCGTQNEIPLDAQDDSYLAENDFLAELEKQNQTQDSASGVSETEAVRCGNCGATTTITSERTADLCPYCGCPLTMQNHYTCKLNIQALLPFVVNLDTAKDCYLKWLGSRWFAPNDFSRRATREEVLKGIYMPFWTYDSNTRTWYRGERGDAYYVTEMVTVTRNGKETTEARQVRRIRWTSVSGTVTVTFDDILIPASQSLPHHLQNNLQPWQLQNLKPFRQEFLSGFVTETYQVPLKEGFEEAKQVMQPKIMSVIRRDIGGDEQRISSTDTKYSKITFKHILLPVWISAYNYNGKTYRFMVNAQTGNAVGDRPWSVWKIAGAILGVIGAGIVLYLLQGGAM